MSRIIDRWKNKPENERARHHFDLLALNGCILLCFAFILGVLIGQGAWLHAVAGLVIALISLLWWVEAHTWLRNVYKGGCDG